MKRYKQRVIFPIAATMIDECEIESYRHDNGEWVKWEDVRKADCVCKDHRSWPAGCFWNCSLHGKCVNVDTLDLPSGKISVQKITETESIECNCAEKSQNLQIKISDGTIPNHPRFKSWICPAHGYKKL